MLEMVLCNNNCGVWKMIKDPHDHEWVWTCQFCIDNKMKILNDLAADIRANTRTKI